MQLARVPLVNVASAVTESIVVSSSRDHQHQLWKDGPGDSNEPTSVYLFDALSQKTSRNPVLPFFVSFYANGTSTGVLREHALRLNSSLQCDLGKNFPSFCPGENPFTANYTWKATVNTTTPENGAGRTFNLLQFRVCAPGDVSKSPWDLNNDRQDITEDVYLDYLAMGPMLNRVGAKFTIRCTANTTRGYFELPNYWNSNKVGNLLNKWPSEEVLAKSFNNPSANNVGR